MAEIDDELNNLNRSIKETIDLLRKLKQESVASRGGVVSEEELRSQEKLNQLLRERRQIARETPIQRAQRRLETGGANAGGPVNSRVGYDNLSDSARKIIEENERKVNEAQNKLLRRKIRQIEQQEKEYARAETGAKREEVAAEREAKAYERAALAAEKKAKAAEHIANAQAKVANDPRYRQALEQASKLGLGVQDLQKVEERGGGVQGLLFRQKRGGVDYNYRTFVDEGGRATPGLSSQFRSFGKDIIRDIGQFTKWSIAVAAVYTPLQKLGELMTIMVDNESRLADAAIAANVPFSKSGEIFDTVAVAAEKAGEGINTTIDAYTSAIRSAGRYTDESTKQAAAIKLLDDALVLSKLSTLDQADSIDVLSAALLQSDRSLIQGADLLNKWVRVSQIANVDITALATGVAVLGDSAETVGLSVDQLNGLIAVLSEQSISGAKEAANTAKALVGAYQSDKAEAALNKYGIALRRANGEVRGFLEIYQELSRLRQQGVLSEAAVGEVALALGGGGVRRAKDASALINSTERLNNIAKESAKITGEDSLAQDALSKKLETVQTANTRLANSFQELAQTLGTDGGLLDSFKGMINLLTGITKATNDLFGLLGRSGPLLATFTAGLLALATMSSGRKEIMLAGLGGQFFKGGQFLPGGGRAPAGGMTVGAGYGAGIMSDILRMNYRGAGIVGGLGVAAQAGSNLAAGRNEQAIGNVAGGAIGAAIGASLGGPIGLAAGANIGSAIGDAFVTAVNEHSSELADYFVPKTTPAGKAPTAEVTYRGKTTEELLNTAYESIGFLGQLKAFFSATTAPGIQRYGGKKESAALDIVKTQNPALYQEIQRQYLKQQADLNAQANLTKITGGEQYAPQRKGLEEQATKARQEQLNRLATGQITTAEFGRISNQISGFPAAAIQSVTAFGDEFIKVSKNIDNTKEAYDAFLYISTYGTQDQINLISQYSNDINTLSSYLDALKENPAVIGTKVQLSFGEVEIKSPEQLRKLITDYQKQGATALDITLQQVQKTQAQAVKLPPLVGDYNKPLTGKSQDIVVQRGLAIQEKYLQETGKTAEEMATFKAAIEAFYATVDRGAGANFEAVNGLTQQFYDLAKAAAEAAGQLEEINKPIGFQKFDVPFSVLQDLAQKSLQIGQGWQQKFNYDFKPEDQIAIDQQGIVNPLHADFKILALLLQDLNDKAQKQLDGQYNIPEGATFWVPLTAAYYRRQAGSEGGNTMQNLLDSLSVDQNTGATDQNTNALTALTNKIGQTNVDKFMLKNTLGGGGEAGGGGNHFQRITGRVQNIRLDEGVLPPDRRYDSIENLRAGRTMDTGQQTQTWFERLIGELRNIFSTANQNNPSPGRYGPAFNGAAAGGGPSTSVAQRTPSAPTNPTTKLDLKVSSNINLLVDGRILASTLQTYLASELLRTDQTQGTITRRFIA